MGPLQGASHGHLHKCGLMRTSGPAALDSLGLNSWRGWESGQRGGRAEHSPLSTKALEQPGLWGGRPQGATELRGVAKEAEVR